MTDTVTLHVWRVRPRDVPTALMTSRITARRLRRHRDVTFAKVLGTASDAFLPAAVTPQRWAAVICRQSGRGPVKELKDSPLHESWWERHAVEQAALTLQPLSSRGRWDGRDPFVVRRGDDGALSPVSNWSGPVVALTRSRLRLGATRRFYRAVPPVAAELRGMSGCRVAFGIGEAPVVRQGTISIWESAAAMKAFAYRSPQHAAVVAATPTQDWYAEELFTRFALLDATGTIDGTAVA
jgi:hypothetical protein